MEKPLLIGSPYNKFPLTIIVWKSLERPQKKRVNWLEARRNHFFHIGFPSWNNCSVKNPGKLFQGEKTQKKLKSWKVKGSETKFIEGKNTLTYFLSKKILGKKFTEKSREVNFKYSETHGKNLSALVTPWSIKVVEWESVENNFILENPRNLFSFRGKPRNWASCTEKPRKLIFSKENLLKPTPSTGIRRKFIFKLE